jgi:hypothetical protein
MVKTGETGGEFKCYKNEMIWKKFVFDCKVVFFAEYYGLHHVQW